MYKIIGFDYGGVVYGKPGSVFDRLVSDAAGVDTRDYRTAYFRHSNVTDRTEMWTGILKELNALDALQDVLAVVAEYSNNKELNVEVLKLIAELKKLGYIVGLLSNNSKAKADEMRVQGLENLFDIICISAEIGYRKPDINAYKYLVSTAGCSLKDLLFIDDTPECIQGLEEQGASTIVYESATQLRSALHDLGVLHNRSNKA